MICDFEHSTFTIKMIADTYRVLNVELTKENMARESTLIGKNIKYKIVDLNV